MIGEEFSPSEIEDITWMLVNFKPSDSNVADGSAVKTFLDPVWAVLTRDKVISLEIDGTEINSKNTTDHIIEGYVQ